MPKKRSLAVVVGLAATGLCCVGGCDKSRPTARARLSSADFGQIIAYVLHDRGYNPDAPPGRLICYLDSGRVLVCSIGADVDVSEFSMPKAEFDVMRQSLQGAALAKMEEVAYWGPDMAHTEIGIRRNGRLRTYAWTEDVSGLSATPDDPNKSEKRFIRAWNEALEILQWDEQHAATPVANASVIYDQICRELREP